MKRVFWDVLVDCNKYRMFCTQLPVNESLELDEKLKTYPFPGNWVQLSLKLWEGEKGKKREEKKKPLADFMATGLLMDAISPRARTLLEPLITKQVEFLPFETPVGLYHGLHVKYVDCLDVDHAEVIRFKSSGRIMEVEKYAFYWERLEGIHIFRVPELGLSRLFVSDEFKRVVEENSLTGLLFYPVPLVDETE